MEKRLVDVKKARESSVRVKGSFATSTIDPKVDKSSPTEDADMSDLLKMDFLSSPSTCFKLVDHIYQVGKLDIFSVFPNGTLYGLYATNDTL